MPLMQDYDVEVEIIVKVRNASNDSTLLHTMVASQQKANSYTSGKSIPAAVTKAIDELHKTVAAHARLARDHETQRLK